MHNINTGLAPIYTMNVRTRTMIEKHPQPQPTTTAGTEDKWLRNYLFNSVIYLEAA